MVSIFWLYFAIFLSAFFGFLVACIFASKRILGLEDENRQLMSDLVSKKELLGEYEEVQRP